MLNRIPPVTKNLLLINILIWAICSLAPQVGASLDSKLALHYFSSPDFNAIQLFTYMFLHSGFTHLFFNMFALWMFGQVIERALGAKRFLFYYITCGIGAALIQEGVFAIMLDKYVNMFTPEEFEDIIHRGARYIQGGMNYVDPTLAKINALVNGATVGASGAVYAILLAFGMLFPNQPIYLMFIPIPIKAKWMVLTYGVIELLLGASGAADNVAHWAHLGGMIFGVLLILYWKKRGDLNDRWFF
ncbi:MAG: rhomboid family intramembrane serine protease [Muribaculaceae bacterium]|nr:rhomboid family intramembrane serine protease [Muribaculaceae bacterium]